MSDALAGFCSFCGTRMVRNPEPNGYNTNTGEPRWTYSCPNAKGKRGFWNVNEDHDEVVSPLFSQTDAKVEP